MIDFEAILHRYGRSLARVAASYEADRALQEDLLQDMLLAIHRSLPQLRDPDRVAPFVFRIAHNHGVNHVARRMAARRLPLDPELHEPAPAPDAEAQLLEGERAARLLTAVRRLPLPYRDVIMLVLEDLSHADIAEALEISLTNVAVRVNRAKAMLREMLDHD